MGQPIKRSAQCGDLAAGAAFSSRTRRSFLVVRLGTRRSAEVPFPTDRDLFGWGFLAFAHLRVWPRGGPQDALRSIFAPVAKDWYMNLRHLEWLVGEPVPDPEMVVYEVLPYAPAQADRVIEQLCGLAGLDVGQAKDDSAGAERVRQAFGLIVHAARARQALLELNAIDNGLGKALWRDLLKELRHDRGRFAATIRDKSARIALRWALRDLGLAGGAGRRWLHQLRDNRVVLRRTIDRALEARMLQRDVGRTDRIDRVVLVQGVGRAYQLLTGKPLGRSLTADGTPMGPGVRLVRVCLKPLDPLVTDDAIVWAIRRVQDQSS